MSTSSTEQTVINLKQSIADGSIANKTLSEMAYFSGMFCNSVTAQNFNSAVEFKQAQEVVQLHLQRAIAQSAEIRARNMQWIVVFLTAVSLIGTVIQSTIAIRTEFRTVSKSQSAAPLPQKQETQSLAPHLAAPPTSGQTNHSQSATTSSSPEDSSNTTVKGIAKSGAPLPPR